MINTASATTIRYESTTCGRCGGTGTYCHYGPCYGCNGQGKKMTRRGAAAHAAVEQFVGEHFMIAAGDLKPGDTFADYHSIVGVNGVARSARRLTWTVTEVRADELNGPEERIVVTATSRWRREPVQTSWGLFRASRLQLPLTGDRWAAVVEFAAGVKGAILETKTAAA